jgi:mono/diheme cytochrome c family protein
MSKVLRWAGYGLVSLIGLVLVAAGVVWLLGGQKLTANGAAKPEHLVTPTSAQLADAPRQLRILGCLNCHGEGLRGDLFFKEPHVATIYAPNLTLVAASATDEQLARAIRQGIGTDGRALAIMPSSTYARLDDSEVAALIAAIRALPKVDKATPKRQVGILGRIGLLTGKFHTQPEVLSDFAAKMPLDAGPKFARGRHLVGSNCAECHGPDLKGAEVEPGVIAPDLSVAGAYELAGFTKLLRTGVPAGGRKLKLMDDVAKKDLSHYTDEEIAAMHAYLTERAQHAQ